MKKIYRHGDIGIIPINKIKKEYKVIKNNILAWGEATGHNHKILPKTKEDIVEVYENEKGELAVKVKGKAVLTHQEHKTIEIPTGTYMVQREREYDYWSLSTRKVID